MGSGQNRTETVASSSTESSSSLTGGLRFGQKIYLEDGSGSGLSKNRGHKSTTTTARCQVEGCRVDLSNDKVCCIHSKSSKVIVSGLLQRFCQQCSRFHQLSEFDLEKRSCRRRLACHNERRRKPQATTADLLASGYSRIAPSPYGSVLRDPTAWSTARDSHQLMNGFSQGRSGFSITYPETVNNSSTGSSCALSLLSNSNTIQQQKQQQQQLQTSSTNASMRVTMAQSPPVSVHSQYLNQTWEFTSGEKSSNSPDEVQFLTTNGTTTGGFELSLLHQQVLRQYLELDNSRACDSSTQHFTWPL